MATASDPNPTIEIEIEASPSPSKRPKTETLTLISSSSSKGKSKIEDEIECCGICLLEEGKAIRGWIDCCDHRFCFICIMEWAKVESRCPLCKRRFETIRRPPKVGLFPSERVVNVPVRDQYYNGLGNSTIGPPNRYMEVKCSVCHGVSDEILLLLCDLCDSASHTYCVGLGVTVPEGDWFCHDCTLLRNEHTESEVDHNCDSPAIMGNCNEVRLAKENVSIHDIIRETDQFGNERRFPRRQLSSSVVPETAVTSAESGARTLHRCRNVQVRIQALRKNWNAYRTGSLNFSTNLNNSFNASHVPKSDQQNSSSFSSQQSTSMKDSSSSVLPDKGSRDVDKACSRDVDKAWKMMNAAKSIGQKNERILSKNPVSKVSAPKEAGKSSLTLNTSNRKQLGKMDHGTGGIMNSHHSCSRNNNDGKYKYKMFEKAKQKGDTLKDNKRFVVGDSSNASGFRDLSSSRKGQTAVQVVQQKTCFGVANVITTPAERLSLLVSDVSCAKQDVHASSSCNSQMGMVSSTLTERPSLRASEISCAKQELHVSSCSSQKRRVEGLSDSKVLKADEAKSEIQSLVKLNLKLLTKDEKLEVDAFKEVARHATHSILATCGLERPKVGMRSFPSSVCHHGEEMLRQLHRSTLMPTSCRECFFAFAKDVVKTILLERKGYSRAS